MGLKPVDIYNKQFSKSLRGYDVDQVNEFLDLIIKEFEDHIKEKKELLEKIDKLENRIVHFSNLEETLNKSIMIAQDTSERVKEEAEKEAKQIILDGQREANRMINSALEKSRNIENELDKLRNHAKVFRTRFRNLIGAQLSMLENDDWDELQEVGKNKYTE